MIQTIRYNSENFPIPSGKIFEKILNLEESLDGQEARVPSIFNPADTNPSMTIFIGKEGFYRFMDFSSGKYGDAADIVMFLYDIKDRQQAFMKIKELFKDDNFDYTLPQYEKPIKKITDYTIRKWIGMDEKFWFKYGVSGKLLKEYNVKPLEDYTMTITKGQEVNDFKFQKAIAYGYFDKHGSLYKIYNPNNKETKYIKVEEYIQGMDQINPDENQCLIIAAGLKDIMAFKALKFKGIDCIAPDSENVDIPEECLNELKKKYKYIFTMFDNDVAGMKSMKSYKEKFGIQYIYFNVEKDIADCVKEHGLINTKLFLKPLIKDAIQKQNHTTDPF